MPQAIALTAERQIEIFRTGTHRPMRGPALVVDGAMLQEVASSYDAANHEAPLVIGHPALDDPARGWVKGLHVDGDRLVATVDEVQTAFSEAVRDGQFKKISPWLYPPRDPANPTPGKWHLKHVGFLGAKIPAVKGLRPVQFAGDDEGAVGFEFSEGGGQLFRNVADIFRSMRDYMIEQDGKDAADSVLPDWRIEWLREAADRLDDDADSANAFTEPNLDKETVNMADTPATPTAEELAKRQAELDTREQETKKREAAFAERESVARTAENETFVDGLIEAARLPSGMRGEVLAFMEAIDGGDAFAFGEGDDDENLSAVDAFKRITDKLPVLVSLEEAAGSSKHMSIQSGYAFAAPGGFEIDIDGVELDQQAKAYQKQNPNTPYLDAVKAVQSA